MTHFKNNNKKLEKLRGIFFQVGLIIAGGLTLVAFEWTSPIYISDLPTPDEIIEEPWELPPLFPEKEEVEKPKVKKEVAPKINPEKFEIVPDDKKLEVEKKEKTKQPEFNPDDWKTPTTDPKPVEKVFLIAGVMPHFKGCESLKEEERKVCTRNSMFQHFGKSIKVPEKIKMLGSAEYKAYVYFEINKKGEVVNVKIMNNEKNSIPKELEREAYKAVSSLPQMNPGKNHGKPVRVKYTVPIKFTVL